MSAPDRRAAEARGRRGEWLAAAFLLTRGWWPVAHRVRTPLGEIDLIVRRGRRLALVEVKRRSDLGAAIGAVTPAARGRIGRAARWWLARHPRYQAFDITFDVVAIVPGRLPRHLSDAFRPGD